MADQTLRIGAEFDVSQIVAGSAQASAAFDQLGKKVGDASAEMLNKLYPTEQAVEEETKALAVAADTASAAQKRLALATIENTAAQDALKQTLKEIGTATPLSVEQMNALTAAQTRASLAADELKAAQGRSSEGMIQARVTTDLLTGNISRAENALIRFASHGSVIGPIMQAAFLPFAAIAFAEIIEHMYEAFQKLSDGVMGYTEEVKRAYEADAKFSTEALGHAQTLGEAQSKLTEILREEGQAAQSFGDRFVEAAQRAEQSTSSFITTIPILGSAVLLYESLAHAESDAADQAIRLGTAQRSLMAATVQQQIALDREALKLIGDRTAAENAGASSHIAQIRNEIAALADKQKVEEDLAVHEAGLKAMTQGGNAVEAENAAKAAIDQEYYYKRLELTNQLSKAEADAAERAKERAFESLNATQIEAQRAAAEELRQIEAVQRKKDEAAKKAFEDGWREFDMNMQVQQDITRGVEEELHKREALQRQEAETQATIDQRIADAEKRRSDEAQKLLDKEMKGFAPINRAFDGMVQGILLGTQTISQAFARMGGNILISTIEAIAMAGLKWAEHFALVEVLEHSSIARRVAAFLAGETTKHAAEVVSGAASATVAAGLGSAWAYESVLASLPFPINVATAPGVAAAEFAAIEAIGLPKAEFGAMIPRDMPIMAHGGEMVLPKHLTEGLSKLIAGGQGGGTNIMVNALDPQTMRDYLHRNQRTVTAAVRGMIRNGVR